MTAPFFFIEFQKRTVKMLSYFKNKITPILLVILLSSTNLAFADSPSDRVAAIDAVNAPNSSSLSDKITDDAMMKLPMYKSVDDAFEPLQNRIILSLFGREAAVAALTEQLPKPIKEQIISLNSVDLAKLVDPFPSSAIAVVSLVFRVLYIIAFSFWLYMFSSYAFNRLFSKHASDLEGSNVRMGVFITSVRSFVVMALCVPMFSDKLYSQVHMVGFKMVGMALGYAQQIDNTFSVKQKVGGVRYFVPKPSWSAQNHPQFFKSITSFSNCIVRGGGNASSVTYGKTVVGLDKVCETRKDKSTCNSNISMDMAALDGTCTLYVSQMIPNGDIADAVKQSKGDVHVDFKKYTDVATKAFSNTVHDLVSSSIDVGYYALHSNAAKLKEIKYSSDATSSFVFNKVGWFRDCDLKTNKGIKEQIDKARSLGDLKSVIVNEQLCQSAYLIKKYGYPDSAYGQSAEKDQVGRSIDLCNGKDVSSVSSCATKICSSISKDGATKLFSCAYAAASAGAYYKTSILKKMGFIVTPALVASDVDGLNMPVSLQSILSSWVANPETTAGNFANLNDNKESRTLREKSDLIFNDDDSLESTSKHLSEMLRKNTQKADGTIGEFLGFNRFYGCVAGGGEYTHNGVPVVCSTSLSEIHRFGLRLLRGWAIMQAGSLTRSVIKGKAEKSENSNNDSNHGSIDRGDLNEKPSSQQKQKGGSWKRKIFNGFDGLRRVAPLGVVAAVAVVFYDKGALENLALHNDAKATPYGNLSDDEKSISMNTMTAYLLGVALSASSASGKAAQASNWAFGFIKWGFLATGVCLGIIIPVVPIFLFYFALVAAFANFTAAMIALNFHIIYALAGVGNDVISKLRKLVSKWLLILMRIPMLVVGFWMSMYILDGCLPTILSTSTMAGQLAKTQNNFVGIFSFIVMLIVWGVMFYVTVFTILDSVTGTYLTVKSLVFEDDSSEFSGNTNSASKVGGIKAELGSMLKK